MSESLTPISVEIAKLTLRPGDTLVVRAHEMTLNHEQSARILDMATAKVPRGVKVMVIDRNFTLAVLQPGVVLQEVA